MDVLAFSPHPDDAELGTGGFLLEMRKKGYTTGIVDLTAGELSSAATAEIRAAESEEASRLLDLEVRETMNFRDGSLTDSFDSRLQVAEIIRRYKPRVVLAPYHEDRHPDHVACSLTVKSAVLYARLKKLGEPHYLTHLYYYMLNTPFAPTFIMDISHSFEKKMEVLSCYRSQFGAEIPLLKDYIPHARTKASYYGSLVSVAYGEPFGIEGFLKVSDPVNP
ncbi:MAG: bacillithiol biosynthesis deacetylase BshB1 [Theionarchaea archaeon]|nr:bacillithiol biosynthesis deacetylase BshB1 [Theionarchaea archaeon]MBU7037547.1 bacillithiol biosynthesis deacetylase BshB1 [Theionarchaea archaeon]